MIQHSDVGEGVSDAEIECHVFPPSSGWTRQYSWVVSAPAPDISRSGGASVKADDRHHGVETYDLVATADHEATGQLPREPG